MLTLQSKVHFSRALVSAKSTLCMCHPWRQSGDALAWFKAGHQVCQPWGLLRGNSLPSLAAPCALPRDTWYEPQSNLKVAAAHWA